MKMQDTCREFQQSELNEDHDKTVTLSSDKKQQLERMLMEHKQRNSNSARLNQ
jgi:hypothetical protein